MIEQAPSPGTPNNRAWAEGGGYLIGLIASIVLTAIAFAAVIYGLPKGVAITTISIAGVVQVMVHLRSFLHLRFSNRQATEDLLLLLFTVILLAIMIGGTIWILSDLNHRMHETTGMICSTDNPTYDSNGR